MDVLIDYEKLSCNLYMVKYTSCKCTQLDAFGILQREDRSIRHHEAFHHITFLKVRFEIALCGYMNIVSFSPNPL